MLFNESLKKEKEKRKKLTESIEVLENLSEKKDFFTSLSRVLNKSTKVSKEELKDLSSVFNDLELLKDSLNSFKENNFFESNSSFKLEDRPLIEMYSLLGEHEESIRKRYKNENTESLSFIESEFKDNSKYYIVFKNLQSKNINEIIFFHKGQKYILSVYGWLLNLYIIDENIGWISLATINGEKRISIEKNETKRYIVNFDNENYFETFVDNRSKEIVPVKENDFFELKNIDIKTNLAKECRVFLLKIKNNYIRILWSDKELFNKKESVSLLRLSFLFKRKFEAEAAKKYKRSQSEQKDFEDLNFNFSSLLNDLGLKTTSKRTNFIIVSGGSCKQLEDKELLFDLLELKTKI